MFKIESDPNADWYDNKIVIDHERQVFLKKIAGLRGDDDRTHYVYRLIWEDRIIPFKAVGKEKTIFETINTYMEYYIYSFGLGANNRFSGGIADYEFTSEEEREQANMLAVEAMLIMSGHYNGDVQPDGEVRIFYEGRHYTKKDFGMA